MIKLVFSLSSLSLVGYTIGLLNQIIIANKFGTSAELDIYLLALAVVNFGWFFIGPINEISIPDFFKNTKESNQKGSLYFSRVLNIILLISLTISLLMYTFLAQIFEYISKNIDINYVLFKDILVLLLPIILLTALSQYFQSVLNSLSKYTAQSVGKIVTASISVIFLLLYFDNLGIKAVVYGVELGLLVLVIFQYILISKLNIKYSPFCGLINEKKYYKHTSILALTYLLSAFQLVYEKFVLLSFGKGILSSYNYSFALLQVPQQVVISAIVAIAWTNFMTKLHEKDLDKGLDELYYLSLNSFIISLLLAITIHMFSKEIIYVLFYRGQFGDEALNSTALILSYLILSLPVLVISNILGRALVVLKKIKKLLIINIISSLGFILVLFIAYILNNIMIAIVSPVVIYSLVVLYKIYLYKGFYIDKPSFGNLISLNLYVLIIGIFFSAIIFYLKNYFLFINEKEKISTILILLMVFFTTLVASYLTIKFIKLIRDKNEQSQKNY